MDQANEGAQPEDNAEHERAGIHHHDHNDNNHDDHDHHHHDDEDEDPFETSSDSEGSDGDQDNFIWARLQPSIERLGDCIASSDDHVRDRALQTVVVLIRRRRSAVWLALVPALVAVVLHARAPQSRVWAAMALMLLSEQKALKRRLVDAGLPEAYGAVVEHEEGQLQLIAVTTLLHLSVAQGNKERMAESLVGSLRTVIACRHGHARDNTLVTLMNLADLPDSAWFLARQNGLVGDLLAIARHDEGEPQCHALTCLGNMAHWGNAEVHDILIDSGCLETLSALRSHADTYVQLRSTMAACVLSLPSHLRPISPWKCPERPEAAQHDSGSHGHDHDHDDGHNDEHRSLRLEQSGGDQGLAFFASVPEAMVQRMVQFLGDILGRNEFHRMTWDITEPLYPLCCICISGRHARTLASARLFKVLVEVLAEHPCDPWTCELATRALLEAVQTLEQVHGKQKARGLVADYAARTGADVSALLRQVKHARESNNANKHSTRLLLRLGDGSAWEAFLMGRHARLGRFSPVRLLPRDLLPLVLRYV